jgi:hypothetical protein
MMYKNPLRLDKVNAVAKYHLSGLINEENHLYSIH